MTPLSVLIIKGTNLIGEVVLRQAGMGDIIATVVRSKETDAEAHFSDLTEVKATFDLRNMQAQNGFKLIIVNGAGDSNAVDGFDLVP
jgi:hypothetical protein